MDEKYIKELIKCLDSISKSLNRLANLYDDNHKMGNDL